LRFVVRSVDWRRARAGLKRPFTALFGFSHLRGLLAVQELVDNSPGDFPAFSISTPTTTEPSDPTLVTTSRS